MNKKMTYKYWLNLFFTLVILSSARVALAIPPDTMNYQGYLTDSSGVPIDGPVNMVFAIYDIDTGGTVLWSDSQSVTAQQGVFSVELGGIFNPFPVGLFESPLWVGLTVGTDAEMVPRRPISSVGFSFKAGDADTLEGVSATTLDQSAHVTDTANPHSVTAAQTGGIDAATLATTLSNYTTSEEVTVTLGDYVTGTDFTTHTSSSASHHLRYTEAEVIAAMGAKSDTNPLHHDRYTDEQAISAVGSHVTSVDGLGGGALSSALSIQGVLEVTPGTYYFISEGISSGYISPRCSCDVSDFSKECPGSFYSENDGTTCYDWYKALDGTSVVNKSVKNVRQATTPSAVSVTTEGSLSVNSMLSVDGVLEVTPGAYFYSRNGASVDGQFTPRCECDSSSTSLNCAENYYSNIQQTAGCYDWSRRFDIFNYVYTSQPYTYSSVAPPAVSVSSQGTLDVKNNLTVDGDLFMGNGSARINASGGTDGDGIYGATSTGVGIFGKASGTGTGVKGTSTDGYAGDFDGSVRVSGLIEANGGIQLPLSNYVVSSNSTVEQTVITATHNFCALTLVQVNGNEPGTYKWCQVSPNGDGTWTLGARGTSALGWTYCRAYCF